MNDLVRPTALFTRALIPASAPGGVQGTVSNPPPPVSQLPAGSTLTGVVVGHDAEGHTLVRTDLGTLAVATKAQLPVNSEVTLQIRSSGSQLHILIMHSEAPSGSAQGATASHPQAHAGAQTGASGPRAAPTTAPVPIPAPTAAQVAAIPTSDLLTFGQSVRAVVQSPAATAPTASIQAGPGGTAGAGAVQPVNPALTALATQLTAGSELQLQIVSVQALGTQTTPGTAPGTVPGLTNQSAAYTALPGGSGPTAPPGAEPPGAPTRPSGAPSPAAPQAGTPAGPLASAGSQAPASPHATSQGVAPGPAGAGAPTAPIPGGLSSTAPASGAAASYAAAGGIGGAIPIAEARAAVIGMMPNASALLAAHGIDQATATSSSPSATTTATTGPAATPSATPPTAAAANNGAGPAAANLGATSSSAGGGGGAGTGGALQFTGSVTTVSIAGHPVLQTPLGTLSLEIRAALQVGSQITFELSNTTSLQSGPLSGPQLGSTAALPAPTSLSTLAHSWPTLDEAFQALHEAGAPTSAAAIREAIPQPGTRLASGMLFFLSALSGGDMTRWLGHQALQALKTAGRDGILARLGGDFDQMGRLADNPGGEWRLSLIPLLDGDQVRQLRLFLRHGQQDGDGDGDGEDEEKTRFIVEVELSRLGDLQLDGLVREKRLDLILRSRVPLPEFMRRDIMQIFHDANEITGYRGSIGFQSSIDWKAMPIEAPDADTPPGVMA